MDSISLSHFTDFIPSFAGIIRSKPDPQPTRELLVRFGRDALHHFGLGSPLQLRGPQHYHLQPRHSQGKYPSNPT